MCRTGQKYITNLVDRADHPISTGARSRAVEKYRLCIIDLDRERRGLDPLARLHSKHRQDCLHQMPRR